MSGDGSPNSAVDSAAAAGSMDLLRRLREGDRPRYLCSLFAAETDRPGLLALYNFNLETARIRDTVSGPAVGRLRMKWWHDAVGRLRAGTPPNHPVMTALHDAVRRHGLDPAALSALVEARAADLSPARPDDLAGLFARIDARTGAVGRMSVAVLAADVPPAAVRASDLVCRAWALSGLLRALPARGARGWRDLPRDRLAAAGLPPDGLAGLRYGAPSPDGVAALVAGLAAAAAAALAEARSLSPDCPGSVAPALLPARFADDNLARLAKCGYDPALAPPGPFAPGPGALLGLWWAARRRRF